MAEQKIIITIEEDGKIKAETQGIKGEVCLEELQELLEDVGELTSLKKTDEYYQKPPAKRQIKQEIKKNK